MPPIAHALGSRRAYNCRWCSAPLGSAIFSLGPLWISSFPEMLPSYPIQKDNEPPTAQIEDPRGPRVPLDVVACSVCGLAQLTYSAPRDLLYRDYWYRSSTNESMRAQLYDIVKTARELVQVGSQDTVLDIGANDGTLLSYYADPALGELPHRIGIDPAENLSASLRHHADTIIPTYWPLPVYAGPKAKIITSIAMFYDVDRPTEFVREIQRTLHPEGIWCVQFTDLVSMFRANAFDNLCHEHVAYYRLWDLVTMFRAYDLQVVKLERNDSNGGSIRLWVKHASQGQPEGFHEELLDELASEEEYLHQSGSWLGLATRVEIEKGRLAKIIDEAPQVALYGASTKGNTLLQAYAKLFSYSKTPRFAAERAAGKHGRFTVTGVPIVSEKFARDSLCPGGLLLCLPWHFREGMIDREAGRWAEGVQMVFPLPTVACWPVGR